MDIVQDEWPVLRAERDVDLQNMLPRREPLRMKELVFLTRLLYIEIADGVVLYATVYGEGYRWRADCLVPRRLWSHNAVDRDTCAYKPT